MKEYFNRKYVKKSQKYNFVGGVIVLISIKKRIKGIKNVKVRQIGPCTVVYERHVQFLTLNTIARVVQ